MVKSKNLEGLGNLLSDLPFDIVKFFSILDILSTFDIRASFFLHIKWGEPGFRILQNKPLKRIFGRVDKNCY